MDMRRFEIIFLYSKIQDEEMVITCTGVIVDEIQKSGLGDQTDMQRSGIIEL